MPTDLKELSCRLFEEIWNQQKLNVIDEIISADFVNHDLNSPSMAKGPEGYKQLVRHYLTAFPDTKFTLHDHVSDGQTVASRWTVTSTHTGNLGSIPPTGRHITVTGISMAHVVDGKFVEGWNNWDAFGLMQQLGLIPKESVREAA
jgi:steroid delta-isomerase-like uncharacterized protein